MRKRKRQAVKKLIQCAAVIAAGVLAIILFMLAIWYRGKGHGCGACAAERLDIVTEQIEDAKVFNPALKLAGVLITSYQNTDGEAAGVEWLEQKTDFNILGIIRYSKKVAENTFMRKPIYEYSPCCGAAQGYKKFVTAYTGKAR